MGRRLKKPQRLTPKSLVTFMVSANPKPGQVIDVLAKTVALLLIVKAPNGVELVEELEQFHARIVTEAYDTFFKKKRRGAA